MTSPLKGSKKCPLCGGRGYATDWRPERGFDHRMRLFKCRCCGKMFYYLILNPETLRYLDQHPLRR